VIILQSCSVTAVLILAVIAMLLMSISHRLWVLGVVLSTAVSELFLDTEEEADDE